MKTFSHILRYIAKFFLEWDMFSQICIENKKKSKSKFICVEAR